MKNTTQVSQQEYERDFYNWIHHNITLLRQGRWDEIEIDILIDELESMAKRDKRELISRLMILIAHLLKWQYQPDQRSGSWQGSICEQRICIDAQLTESPSLKNALVESVSQAYIGSLKITQKETGLPSSSFPSSCPYTLEQLLDEDYYPE
jgi:hypothetical protein